MSVKPGATELRQTEPMPEVWCLGRFDERKCAVPIDQQRKSCPSCGGGAHVEKKWDTSGLPWLVHSCFCCNERWLSYPLNGIPFGPKRAPLKRLAASVCRFLRLADAIPLLAVAVLLVWMGVQPARAQTPDEVVQTTQTVAGPLAPCLLSIIQREDPMFGVNQPNLEGSGATGLFQFMPTTWASTPPGAEGVPLAVASVAQQVEAAVWMIENGWKSAWNPAPPSC